MLTLKHGKMVPTKSPSAHAKFTQRVQRQFWKVQEQAIAQLLAHGAQREDIGIRQDPDKPTDSLIEHAGVPIFRVSTIINDKQVQVIAEPIVRH
jgi:hypothetical protein